MNNVSKMLHSYVLLSIVMLVALINFSCTDDEVVRKLRQAEIQVWEKPDSALKILESIPIPEELTGKRRADYALLMTQAKYRCSIPATSDSLINIAVEYYKDKNVDKRAATLLFKGGVFRDMKKDEDAMFLYKQAETYISQLKDIRIKSRIYNSIAFLNQYHNNFSLASQYYKLAMEIDESNKFIEWHANDLMSLASLSYYWGSKDSASVYYKKLLEMLPLVDSLSKSQILYNLGLYQKNEKNWAKAESFLLKSLAISSNNLSYKIYFLLANIYGEIDNKEKIDSLWNRALQTKDMALRAQIYHTLYAKALAEKRYEDALYQMDKCMSASDSFRIQVNQAQVLKIQKKYDRAVLLHQNAEIRSHWYATALLSLLVIIFLSILVYISRNISRKEKSKLLERNEKEVVRLQEIIDKFQLKIEEDGSLHKDEKEKLMRDIVSLKNEKEEKDIQIQQLKEGMGIEGLTVSRDLIESMQVVMKIKSEEHPSYIPAEDRDKLRYWLDLIYHRFGTRLIEIYGLTEREQDVCYLKALELSDEEIAQLLKILPRSIDRCISRIRMKVGFKEGRKEFANFITKFKCL